MTETVPSRMHVRWGKSGDTRVTYMEERFWPPDAEADYVPAAALEAAQARIVELEAEKREAAMQYLADAGQLADALATARREALEEADRAVHDRLVKIPHYDDARIVARSTIRALMEKPNANG